MKFMKLGSRPDTFYSIEALPDFPGGIEAFELCAKFCYSFTITLSAYNIVAIRCAAEYLQMTEDVEKGNLVYKIKVFFNSCILHGWKDSIITLQSTKAFSLWSEDLGITSRCIESIASKVLTHPSKVSLSHSHSRRVQDDMSCNGVESQQHQQTIKVYASRWLPNISRKVKTNREATTASTSDSDSAGEVTSKHKLVLESLVSLLPSEKGAVSCSFLLKLLKVANILNASSSSKMELARRVALQLEEARDKVLQRALLDLGIERRRRSRSAENVDLEFQEARRSSSASHSSKLKVGRIVDGYLQEIAKDVNLPLSKFIAIAETIPNFSRPDHDDLYRAIDIYLKAHPELNKSERKRLCRILDHRKLSVEACMHAAQNEKLPLRVVVQVLFFEQARAVATGAKVANLPSNIKALLASHNIDPSKPPGTLSTTTSIPADDEWSNSGIKSPKSRNLRLRTKVARADDLDENEMNRDGLGRPSKFKAFCALPRRPKRTFNKLLSINKSGSEKN
ncbi:hypothetical protein Golax_005835 [Gossypium laxum]|uniref:NPH3 domain-containing protein n=1 Tax=Gossypium laxum TaxID=34288 RepID=A0A7J9A1X3_9ROSI|nr:hypothetical protein [Gossypium laxum]